jgi:hypothetical protein
MPDLTNSLNVHNVCDVRYTDILCHQYCPVLGHRCDVLKCYKFSKSLVAAA